MEGAWDFTKPDRKCINYVDYLYASSAVNVFTDILLCVLPWPHLWRLNMPLKQRITLCVLFAGGIRYVFNDTFTTAIAKAFSACIVCIVRIGFLHNLRNMDTSCKQIRFLLILTSSRPNQALTVAQIKAFLLSIFLYTNAAWALYASAFQQFDQSCSKYSRMHCDPIYPPGTHHGAFL